MAIENVPVESLIKLLKASKNVRLMLEEKQEKYPDMFTDRDRERLEEMRTLEAGLPPIIQQKLK